MPLSTWIEERILPLRAAAPDVQEREVISWWRTLDRPQRFLLTKLLTGEFRVGVSQTLVVRALAQVAGVATRGDRAPADGHVAAVGGVLPLAAVAGRRDASIDRGRTRSTWPRRSIASRQDLGPPEEWLAEWKWDGIRAQVIRRGGETFIWSRGEELVTERFPEIHVPGGAPAGRHRDRRRDPRLRRRTPAAVRACCSGASAGRS